MEVIKHLEWRYATKKFDENKTLEALQVEELLQAFNLTATSYGLQPVKLVVIQDKQLQKQLFEFSMNQKQVVQASHVFVFCIETSINRAFVENYFKRVHALRNTPKEVLLPFKDFLVDDFEQKEQEKIEQWATNQAYLTMGNMLTVCAVAGIDSCPMEGFIPEAYDKILNLSEKGLKSVLVLPIGYRAEDDMFASLKKVRKPVAESVIFI